MKHTLMTGIRVLGEYFDSIGRAKQEAGGNE
jgi:hypothetical protein